MRIFTPSDCGVNLIALYEFRFILVKFWVVESIPLPSGCKVRGNGHGIYSQAR